MAPYRVWIHPIIHGGSTILPSIDGDSFLLIPPGDIVNLGVSTEGDSFMIFPSDRDDYALPSSLPHLCLHLSCHI